MLKVAGVDEDGLRGLLVEGRALPVTLRDTLERFEVDARVDALFVQLHQGQVSASGNLYFDWCLTQLDSHGMDEGGQRQAVLDDESLLRELLLEHFSTRYLAPDPLCNLIKRDFPGLPDAYASAVLRQASEAERVRMADEQRIPLDLAEKARALLQEARLTRALEGFYLHNGYRAETLDLVFGLLSSRAGWPNRVNLELREGSEHGRRLAMIHPEDRQLGVTTLVRRNGQFRLYNDGRASTVEVPAPHSWEQALLAVLPLADRERLGWDGAQGWLTLRADLRAWLPDSRRRIASQLGLRQHDAWFNPGRRLPDGRVGYLLCGQDLASSAETLFRDRVRALYPGFDQAEVETYLAQFRQSTEAALTRLLREEATYQRLAQALREWEAQVPAQEVARRQVGDELRRCWRHQGERLVNRRGVDYGMRLSIIGVPVQTLPELPEGVSFPHVTDLVLTHLGLEALPQVFLQRFPYARWCNLSNNHLTRFPEQLGSMTRLFELRLNDNRIRMGGLTGPLFSTLGQLRVVDLSRNPLGNVTLDVDHLHRLRELIMRRCQLHRLPRRLLWCPFLEMADLRDNLIAGLEPEIFEATHEFRQTLLLAGNPLSAETQMRLLQLDGQRQPMVLPVIPEQGATAHPSRTISVEQARDIWVGGEDETLRDERAGQWDNLAAEPGSEALFQLFAELVGTSDYRETREDLGHRVWNMIEAALAHGEVRRELFDLSASGRTCVDSVIACFSNLEVRVFMTQELVGATAAQAQERRLGMARRLYRLDQLNAYARADLPRVERQLHQDYPAESVDEVEVNLAYRIGLADRLGLPGQPRTMQFRAMAYVGEPQLDDAERVVRAAETDVEALALYISQRDFWEAYLRQTHADSFESALEPLQEQMTRLDERYHAEEVTEAQYVQAANTLRTRHAEGEEALMLRLTREALQAHLPGTD
ncbi:NEL-type E3 ubiquitin ligase domain-containing protein [Pseudomonas sp. EMN2]|uniref:NEL-type E3 ubiquitin ligase domain-containing protein n=1 Tax=Pseudomonas sp. EMN2 TaxID=2615212 RepID=UPI00273D86F3|nr:NEL-type E3 ubiquitin ligase domain-containing protein [Pseudomonas sp. EMN2]